MDLEQAEFVIEALEAGFTFGYADKDGTMRVQLSEGCYSFYEAGDGNSQGESMSTKNRVEFLRFLECRSLAGFEHDIELASCALAWKDLEAGDADGARAKLERALRWGADLAHVGLALRAIVVGDRMEAASQLRALDQHVARSPHHDGPLGALSAYFELALYGIHGRQRHERVRDACTLLLSVEERADAYYERGCANEQLGANQQAAADLSKALDGKLLPSVRSLAWLRLGRVLLAAGKAKQALAAADSGLVESPHDRQLEELKESCVKAIRGD